MRSTIGRSLIILAVLVSTSSLVVYAQMGTLPAADPTCTPFGSSHLNGQSYTSGTVANTNGLEPEFPIWCYPQVPAGPATRILTANGWIDSWDNNQPAVQTLRDHDYDYRVFPTGGDMQNTNRFKYGTFINTDHWMLDIGRVPNRGDESTYLLSGGILVSPDRTFPFVNGTFSAEADGAAGSDAMGGADAFYEIDISPAAAPTGRVVDTGYGYGQFGYAGALGCRFQSQSEGMGMVCAMYDNSGRNTGGGCVGPEACTGPQRPGRVWETQGAGTANTAQSVIGGDPNYLIPNSGGLHVRDVYRQCLDNEHDLHCRDRLRLELTKNSVHVVVNGYTIMQINGLWAVNPATGADNRIPDSWLQNGVRVYLTSWVNNANAARGVTRWHWNDVNVNTPPAPSISFCIGGNGPDPNTCPHQHIPGNPEVGAAASGTPTAIPTATSVPATATAVPTSTATPVPSATATSTATSTMTPVPSATPTSVPATPTATAVPADVCVVLGERNGVPERFPFPCP